MKDKVILRVTSENGDVLGSFICDSGWKKMKEVSLRFAALGYKVTTIDPRGNESQLMMLLTRLEKSP